MQVINVEYCDGNTDGRIKEGVLARGSVLCLEAG